jgi:2-epi-5-epi-valiolone synthase
MSKYKNADWSLTTKQPVSFKIKTSLNIFKIGNKDILSHGTQGEGSRRIVIIDMKVSNLYINGIIEYFKYYKIDYHFIVIDATEDNKNIEFLLYLLKEIEKFGLTRRSEPIIAIGGGVLLDIVGFAASIYRRGVPYIKVPTTLLGIVDASIGVKTAINFEDRRNRLGSYYPPEVAYLDKSFLKTLDPLEISSGLGEILKMAIVKDYNLFELLKNYGEELYKSKFVGCECADEVIYLSIKGMKDELQENLWEKNLKRYVDFGHSFSPIIEMRSLTDRNVESLTHGQAVTLDVIYSCIISNYRGMLSNNDIKNVFSVVQKLNLPTFHPYFTEPNLLMESLNDTIKHRNGDQNLPIPKSIGKSIFINDLSYEEIKATSLLFEEYNNKLRIEL